MCKGDSPGTLESPNLGYVAQVFWDLKHVLRLNMLWGTVQRSIYQHICPIPPPDTQQGCNCGHGNSLRDTAALKKPSSLFLFYSKKRKERDQCKHHKLNPVVLVFSAAFMWGHESAAESLFLFSWPRMHQTLRCIFSAHQPTGAVKAFLDSGDRRIQAGFWGAPGWCKRNRGSSRMLRVRRWGNEPANSHIILIQGLWTNKGQSRGMGKRGPPGMGSDQEMAIIGCGRARSRTHSRLD